MSRRFLSEHDHDIFEMELAEQRLLDALNARVPCEESEGYPPDVDDANGWVGAEERERVVRGGEQ